MARSITDEENTQLYHEVKAMMDEAEDDERQLSSDEEGYVDGLMEGRTTIKVVARPSEAVPTFGTARKLSVLPAGGQGFQDRMCAAFGDLGSSVIAPSATAFDPAQGVRVGPAFSGQASGYSLAEPLPPTTSWLESDDDEEEEDGDEVHYGTSRPARRGASGRASHSGAGRSSGDGEWSGMDDEESDDDDGGGGGGGGGRAAVDEEEDDDEEEDEEEGEGIDEDPREWSRHTATWAAELSDSADEGNDEGDDGDDGRASSAEGSGASRQSPPRAGSAEAPLPGAAPSTKEPGGGAVVRPPIAAFGGLHDLDDLDDEIDAGEGGTDPALSHSTLGGGGDRRPARKRGAEAAVEGEAAPNARAGATVEQPQSQPQSQPQPQQPPGPAAPMKRVRFSEPQQQKARRASGDAPPAGILKQALGAIRHEGGRLGSAAPVGDGGGGGGGDGGGGGGGGDGDRPAGEAAVGRPPGRYIKYSLDDADDSAAANADGLAQLLAMVGHLPTPSNAGAAGGSGGHPAGQGGAEGGRAGLGGDRAVSQIDSQGRVEMAECVAGVAPGRNKRSSSASGGGGGGGSAPRHPRLVPPPSSAHVALGHLAEPDGGGGEDDDAHMSDAPPPPVPRGGAVGFRSGGGAGRGGARAYRGKSRLDALE
jgi:hypothetical protein